MSGWKRIPVGDGLKDTLDIRAATVFSSPPTYSGSGYRQRPRKVQPAHRRPRYADGVERVSECVCVSIPLDNASLAAMSMLYSWGSQPTMLSSASLRSRAQYDIEFTSFRGARPIAAKSFWSVVMVKD